MWNIVVSLILRYRFTHLLVIGILTMFMGYLAIRVTLSYEMTPMLPDSDSTVIDYKSFKEIFGEDGTVLFVGIKDPDLFGYDKFKAWYDLTYHMREIEGVDEVVSIARLFRIVKNDSLRRFDFEQLFADFPATQAELDSLRSVIYSLPFYDGYLYNRESGATVMMITLDKTKINTKGRIAIVNEIESGVEAFSASTGIETHLSGMPYIRTKTMIKIQQELKLFIILAMLIASVALFVFFRSFKAVLFPMLIVVISVVWALGTMVLFGYKITILTGILPPLLIVIGVENCIFLLNKFHHEYRSHRNKVKALSRVVQRVGNATFLTNLTTAVGFGAFILTRNQMLIEFGVIAFINIMVIFVLSIMLIPIFFSYLNPPSARHIRHLDNQFTVTILEKVVNVVLNHRRRVYIIALLATTVALFGMMRLKTSGNVVDDIPHKDPVYVDLLFFEREFRGILPFEISIDTHKKRGVIQYNTIRRISQLQDTLATYPEFAQPLSVAELTKFLRQAFYNGDPEMYDIPNSQEQNFIMRYVPGMQGGKRTILHSFVDTNMQITRISAQMANIGTHDIMRIKNDLAPKIDSIFPPDQYDVKLTGTSIVFLKGTNFLVTNLLTSLLIALIAIVLIMSMMFTSWKMVGISMVPNLLPQLLTAALMGYLAISIKPSTILIFSIALGISVDNAIHFLSRYRMELKQNNWDIRKSVINALRETGFSMVYSSIVLFLGFSIFTLSTFGGTEALGFLISFTLLIAVLANLFVLPSLLLSLDKRATTRTFGDPAIHIFDENDTDVVIPQTQQIQSEQ
ncbi:MAG: MMPL family transporter [Bacteroidales bacterium]|nr:MMPL family transporter [Bacteroidales bacterium]MDZ4204597.1 MMPL family transporter [Bacteroidales bacterium]